MGDAECGVWKVWSVETVECGKCEVRNVLHFDSRVQPSWLIQMSLYEEKR